MKKRAGFTLVEIMIVMGIIGIMAAIAIPNFFRVKNTANQNACIHNLKTVSEAKEMWALMEGKGPTVTPTWSDLITDHIKKTPACPAGGTYTVNSVDAYPTCTETDHELL